jgi:hypothetical protein
MRAAVIEAPHKLVVKDVEQGLRLVHEHPDEAIKVVVDVC